MEGKANQGPMHEEFEPLCKWQRNEDADTLEIHLQEFKKQQLRVQLSNQGILKISGERSLDSSRKSKFYKEVQVPSNCDESAIHAKFVNGWLTITMPKRKNLMPDKNGRKPLDTKKIDQTPKTEPKAPTPVESSGGAKEKIPTPAGQNDLTTKCEFQGRQCGGVRLAKLAVTVAVAAAMMAMLVGYVVYTYNYKFAVDS